MPVGNMSVEARPLQELLEGANRACEQDVDFILRESETMLGQYRLRLARPSMSDCNRRFRDANNEVALKNHQLTRTAFVNALLKASEKEHIKIVDIKPLIGTSKQVPSNEAVKESLKGNTSYYLENPYQTTYLDNRATREVRQWVQRAVDIQEREAAFNLEAQVLPDATPRKVTFDESKNKIDETGVGGRNILTKGQIAPEGDNDEWLGV